MALKAAFTIFRRELVSYVFTPLGWVIMALFLLVQGYGFYLLVELSAQPYAPHGAVLRLFFGGTMLYWLFFSMIVAAITMRSIAEERRSGTLETLVTAPVGEVSLVAGKYAAALLFFALLWLPTLAYPALVSGLQRDPPLDWGPVAAGYLGTLVLGAACLALGLLCSALSRSQAIAGLATFVLLALLLLLAPLRDLVRNGSIRALAAHLDLFAHMDDFARGIVDTRHLVLHGSIVLFALAVAVTTLEPRRSDRLRARLGLGAGLALLALSCVLVNVIASRHHARSDWTRTRLFTLAPRTERALQALDGPVEVTVFMVPPERQEESLYYETRELLARFAASSPRLSLELVDIDTDPARAALLSKRDGIALNELAEGAIVFRRARRVRLVRAADLADYELAPEGRRISAFRGEALFLEALLEVTSETRLTVCASAGHGEAALDSYADEGYGRIWDEVRRGAYHTRILEPTAGLGDLGGCDMLVVAGPRRGFSGPELDRLASYLERGGRLFLLVGPQMDRRLTRFNVLGLEGLLETWGVSLPDNVVLDPLAVPGEQPLLTWATPSGHGDHPIGRALHGRLTVWPLAREVRGAVPARADASVTTLVSSSSKGWAESDLASLRGERPLRLDPSDARGPVSVALAVSAGHTRIVVFGSERGFHNRRFAGQVLRDFNRDLFLSAVEWLAGRERVMGIGPKAPEHVRLLVDDHILGRVFLLCVVGLPLLALSLALVIGWRRRR